MESSEKIKQNSEFSGESNIRKTGEHPHPHQKGRAFSKTRRQGSLGRKTRTRLPGLEVQKKPMLHHLIEREEPSGDRQDDQAYYLFLGGRQG